MEQPHQLVDQESKGVLTEKILCTQCMYTWWTDEEDLDRELECSNCGHKARVELYRKTVLR
jgi:DNA-directed RNA polymerase subunit RPC12/RpoP